MSLKRVRVEVPKVRRNMKEVRPFQELPGRGGISDNALLWGTACLLFALTLGGGAYLWRQAQDPRLGSAPVPSSTELRVESSLAEARDAYILGEFSRSVSAAQIALALEQAEPSQPPMEGEVRRVLALAHQSQGEFGKAMEQWDWLKSRTQTFKDQESYRRCREALLLEQQNGALEQLRRAQNLHAQGQLRPALAEARQALKLLERGAAPRESLRAGYLLVAQLSVRLGETSQAREALRALARIAPLTAEQKTWLGQLNPSSQASGSASPRPTPRASTARVVVPSLGEGPHYPLGNPGSRRTTLRDGSLPSEPSVAEVPQPAEPGAPPSAAKKVELPRLEMPNSSPHGSLPSYQGAKGSSLPSYRDQGGDSLPAYSGKPQTGGKLPGY